MKIVKSLIVKAVLIFMSYKSGFYILDKIEIILVHNKNANFFIFVGVYFMISVLFILIWCYTLNHKIREMINDLDDITRLIISFFYLPAVIILLILQALLHKINELDKTN